VAETRLPLFIVYKSPSDYPGKFVLRRWHVGSGKLDAISDRDPIAVADSLKEVRDKVPSWCVNIGRYDFDDPVILEVWV
jgi:hypothetical protein